MGQTLSRGMRKFYDFLLTVNTGDSVARNDLLAATEWMESTLSTYLKKNKLISFLAETPDGNFKVLRAGPALRDVEVARAMTQVSPATLVLAQGDRIQGEHGTYVLDRHRGAGAVAEVWSAESTDGERVAVKVMSPRPDLLEPTKLSNVKKRFAREAKNGMKLSHASVIHNLDRGTIQGQPFLVMELAKASAKDVLDTRGEMAAEEAIQIISSCLDGLIYLHESGCIHRDVKPANILRLSDRWVLGDLGIVRWSDLNPEFTSAATITKSSIQLGSWFYMAPEQQANAHTATERSDIYALGVTWYELLTRETSSPAAFAAQRFPRPTSDQREYDLIGQMTQYNPDDRPTAVDLLFKISAQRS